MIKNRNHKKEYTPERPDLETVFAKLISKTGKDQIKKRMKAGLSAYFLKNGKIIELKPDRSKIEGNSINARWLTVEKSKRKLIIK